MVRGDAAPEHPEWGDDDRPDAARQPRKAPEREWPEVGFEPSYATLNPIPHYYGSFVRELLVGAAVLMLVASPLYTDNIQVEFPFVLLGALAAALVAALTNPRVKSFSIMDAVVSGVGLVVFASWAIFQYDSINILAFTIRILIALIFLFAFYFSMKTVRAFVLHQIGKVPDLRDLQN